MKKSVNQFSYVSIGMAIVGMMMWISNGMVLFPLRLLELSENTYAEIIYIYYPLSIALMGLFSIIVGIYGLFNKRTKTELTLLILGIIFGVGAVIGGIEFLIFSR